MFMREYIGKLDTKALTMRETRKLNTKASKQLLAAGHGYFFNHLKWKCKERGIAFLQASEHFTSQTCPECGRLTKCKETFSCRHCGFKHGRDAVGALNILLRAVRTQM